MNYDTLRKAKVIAKAAPTYLVAGAVLAPFVVDELTKVVGADSPVVAVAVRVAAWIGAAVVIIRRSTPVLEGARGILPTREPVTSSERYLAREITYMRSVIKGGG